MSTRAPGGGRKPKPTAQKRAAGNPGKRRLNDAEPDYTSLVIAPPAPDWMSEYAQQMWHKLAPELVESKVLTRTDLHVLEGFCSAYGRWREAEEDVTRNGITIKSMMGRSKNPACTVANEAMRQMTSYGSSLGLDPASRARLTVPKNKAKGRFSGLLAPKDR
ncbi:Phage terminase, small subunit [compost metagenome]